MATDRTPPLIIGVDPGGQWVGVVARQGRTLIAHKLVTRRDTDMQTWITAVLDAITHVRTKAVVHDITTGGSPGRIAVEGLNPPNPHMGITSVRGLLDTAQVLGAVVATYRQDVLVIPPDGHGSGPITAYPAPLYPKTGKGRGHDQNRHCRSAWDIAAAAAVQLRLQEASR
mgnify:CR=1 FL=1